MGWIASGISCPCRNRLLRRPRFRRRIEVLNNLARNNGGCGIEIQGAIEGTVQGNRLFDNAPTEQLRVISSQKIRR